MKVLVAGDFCDNGRISEKISKGEYNSLFDEVIPITEQMDFSIVNFEFPVVLSKGKPIIKCGPHLRGQKLAVEAIKYAGFNICTLANNHILDQGEQCCLDTKRLLEETGIHTVGVGQNLTESSTILYLEKKDEKLAIINCCEHEYSIATETKAGANPLNPIKQFYKIQEAKRNADYVLVIVHGGNEYYRLPSPRMQETYRFFIDAGADAVVNHHQHCYSGYEIYNKCPIFYGLGNFCFDRLGCNDSSWNEGYMVCLTLGKDVEFGIFPYKQCDVFPKVSMLGNSAYKDKIDKLNDIIKERDQLEKKYDEYIDKSSNLHSVFGPYTSRILKVLCHRHILPSFMNKNKRNLILAYIQCESHYPKVINYLKK